MWVFYRDRTAKRSEGVSKRADLLLKCGIDRSILVGLCSDINFRKLHISTLLINETQILNRATLSEI